MSAVIHSATLLQTILDHPVATSMNDEERHQLEHDLWVETDEVLQAKLDEFDELLKDENVIAAE